MLSSSFRQLIRFHTTYTEHNTGISYPFIRSYTLTAPRLASPPKQLLDLPSLSDETHHALARTWLDGFTLDDIPKNSYEVTYSRSSGPGGQVSSGSLLVVASSLWEGPYTRLTDWL